MPTTTNFGWTTPADTDLVKDGALAIRTLGNGIDTSLVDLKGGTTDQLLAKNSNTDMDFKWVAAPVTTANWSLLNAGGTALTGAATITVSGISAKESIMVIVDGASSANASSFIGLRVNTDSNNIYYAFGQENTLNSTYSATMFASRGEVGNSINIARMGDSAANTVDGAVTLSGCNSAGVKPFISIGAGNGTTARQYALEGYVDLSATISSISVISSTGNFDAGTVFVYATA
jgi:hypothetical protein